MIKKNFEIDVISKRQFQFQKIVAAKENVFTIGTENQKNIYIPQKTLAILQ